MNKKTLASLFLGVCIGCSASNQASSPIRDKEWGFFWKDFCAAAKNKDRKAIRAVMSDKFDYTFGDGPTTPEGAFKFWEDTQFDAWLALQQVTGEGSIDYIPPPAWNSKGKVKISPPQAAGEDYTQMRAIFEESPTGRWRWIAFLEGD